MPSDRERAVVQAVLEQDTRPWAKLGDASPRLMGTYVAHAVLNDRSEAEALAEEMRALGYDVKIRERVMRSDAADQIIKAGVWVVSIAAAGGGAIIFTTMS